MQQYFPRAFFVAGIQRVYSLERRLGSILNLANNLSNVKLSS